MQITHRGRNVAVPEQALNGMQIDAGFEQVRGKGVAQGMDTATRWQSSGIAGGAIESLNHLVVNRAATGAVRKDPVLRSKSAPVQAQRFEQTG